MTRSDDTQHLASLFSLASGKFRRGDDEAGARYVRDFHAEAQRLVREAPDALDAPVNLAMLHQAGGHDALLELFEAKKGAFSSDFLPIMSASIFFARHEPHKALRAAKHIADLEQRRLRQKTAELWQTLMAPLEAEPRVHLLVLACNREQHVEAALRQLGNTAYGNYAVYIADNGSTDGTWDIVQRAAEFFPAHVSVQVRRFPTNIGRPAGHNWLLTEFDHSSAEYIAIGDDDLVSVPPDWLVRMIRTAHAVPGCACVGGKALSPGWPAMVHGGIRNIIDFGVNNIRLTNDADCLDAGQFDYVDIVDHVIGCLHIFDRRSLDVAGLFDIRFSPCQYVDIEHHLRMRMAGMKIVFNGLVGFVHMRAMGQAAKKENGLRGNSLGNLIKLSHKYDASDVHREITARHEERNQWLLR